MGKMGNRLAGALLLALFLAACGQRPLEVTNVWTRDTVGGTDNAAIFMTIASPTSDRLVSASTPAARQADLMTMRASNGAMEMDYLKAMPIPAGKPVSLNPAGWHVWLSDLDKPLKAGHSFPLSLRFEKAGERTVTVQVIAPAAPPPS
jgi:copper(I)-binding protein